MAGGTADATRRLRAPRPACPVERVHPRRQIEIVGGDQGRQAFGPGDGDQGVEHPARRCVGSRLPVGSSARRMRGLLAKARAMATRCCSPPDNCAGRWRQPLRPAPARSAGASLPWPPRRAICPRSSAAAPHFPARRIPAADDGPDRQSRWCRGGCGCAPHRAAARPPRLRYRSRRWSALPAGPRYAAARICRRPTGPPAPRSRRRCSDRSRPLNTSSWPSPSL